MIEQGRPSATRRAPIPPPALPGELVRRSLLDDMARRFEVPVTLIVAGAGFGKTTLLAQAIRANHAEPRGIDAWISCEPGDEDALRFSRALLLSLGGAADNRDPFDAVIEALGAMSPFDVCLVLDDLHELPAASTAAQLLARIVRQLPPHAHLLLASREPLDLPFARRRAADQVVELGVDRLAFTPDESAALAAVHGRSPGRVEGLAGWPSLVRLVLSAPSGAERQFLWEEIIGGLSPEERTGLLALATLGWGSAGDVHHVAGTAVDLDSLTAKVPLLRREDDGGRFGVHQLWEDAVERLFPAEDLVELRRRALDLLSARGETVRVGSLALRWRDASALRAAARSLVRESFGALPVDTATRWLADAPEIVGDAPELELLALAVRHARTFDDAGLDRQIDALTGRFDADKDDESHAVALALGTIVAHSRGDNARLFALAERVRALPGTDREPILRFLIGAVEAALAGLHGDIDGALRSIDALSLLDVPRAVTELVTRLHVAMLCLAGRADEAIVVAESLRDSSSQLVRGIPALASWLAGDPSGYRTGPLTTADPGADANERDRFFLAAYDTAICASFGDVAGIEAIRPTIDKVAADDPDARDSAMAAVAIACREIVAHDDQAGAGAIAAHLTRYPLSNRLGEVHLRRFLAVTYVSNADARQKWDADLLGAAHQRARAVARQLLDARSGRLAGGAPLAPAHVVFTSLPLPWSAELAVRAHAAGSHDAVKLVRELADWAPDQLRTELRWLSSRGAAPERRAAAALLDTVPESVSAPLHIGLLGPLTISVGQATLAGPELRRGRVRALLTLLALAGPVRRDRVMDLMWPDLDPQAAARNLRVTLSRLRSLLEPDRAPGRPCPSLRIDAETLALAPPPHVDVDLWQLRRHLTDAERAHRAGDSTEVADHLQQVSDLWRGEPLADAESIAELGGEVEQVRQSLIDATLSLGELRLVAGRFDESLACARKVQHASPYSERAHRLAIAAHLQRRDREGAERAVLNLEHALADLGVSADPATEMLIRQVQVRPAGQQMQNSLPSGSSMTAK